ncbi:PSD1 and planctomycete cytochrome C domain-containing protein [Flavihumibacter fluvii]|uniref:PSD1 and planctomycete cytochrome C domain-containing protein n=1 Tax=Flavihumibacter fluvii TaxID=2838157 RepID=UPI001EFBD960|nr:PSD1 and planctomycete cytochrome C domain-containing protein [Flavihumibacter fluvii]ULQ54040.1 PSD1 and planctomycete cytochrome C domain-containing protein [Flavihumibacter fluvii]
MLAVLVFMVMPVCFFLSCQQSYTPGLPDKVDFNYDIRPILVQKCYLCHGPDSSSRKGNLRLDTFEGATALSKEGTKAISPGHADKSTMVYRINHKDPEIMMPTPESNLQLTKRERALIERWIDQGAEWKPHWAFIPPSISEKAAKEDLEKNGIDYFINQKLEQNGLEVAPEADKLALIRRVAYLLTGLPPSPEAVDKYLSDNNPDAYAKMTDHYLNSGQFGERWARHWMDMVRYAETKGHEFDYTISDAWRYRDYLIRAFNNDLPYDQMVKEQLAGDLLRQQRINTATGENESQIATVFYALGEGTHSPVDVRQDEADRIDNIIDVTGKTFQGLTISCARCHDHKFDPISTKDYYSMFGIVEGTRFSPIPANMANKTGSIQALQQNNDSVRILIAAKWLQELAGKPALTRVPGTKSKEQNTGIKTLGEFRGNSIGDWKTDGMAISKSTTLGNPVLNKSGKIVALDDGKASSRIIGNNIYGALRSPDFIIDKNYIGVRALGKDASIRIVIDNFQLIQYPIYGDMDQRIDTSGWENHVFDVTQWKGRNAYIEVLTGYFEQHVFKMHKDAWFDVQYAIAYDQQWAEPVQAVSQEPVDPGKAVDHWRNYTASVEEVKALNGLLRQRSISGTIPGLDNLQQQRSQLQMSLADSIEFVSGVTDGYAKNSPVFIRGSYKELSEKPVERAFLSALRKGNTTYNEKGSGRMQLAESITQPTNPLTARVMVNRIWHYLFGKGIVETVDNFGMQGKLPSNPELLDFLAIKFQKDGYSVKKMIRSILMSEAFRRSAKPSEAARKQDPNNIYLSHFPIRRLEAEAIRDALLMASGKLDTTMYGPPVPAYISSFMNGRGKPEQSGPIDGRGRRSIYLEVRRNFLDPMMTTFDRPIPFTAFGKRNVTNVPAQSLILMNDPFVVMQAEGMAKNLLAKEQLTFDNRIQWIYRQALSRPAKPEEISAARGLVQQFAGRYKIKEGAWDNNLTIWKDYIHSVFNFKEFIYLN